MKKFFYSHPETVLVTLAVIFLGMLIWLYTWASNDIFVEVHQALTYSASAPSDSFDLTKASGLDLRGLMSSTSSPAGSTLVLPPVASTTPASTTAN